MTEFGSLFEIGMPSSVDSVIFFEIGILPSSGTPNLSLSSIPPTDLNKSTLYITRKN